MFEEAIIEPPKRPGMKKGQRHGGQFKSGFDPNRLSVKKYATGESFRALCRKQTPQALAIITQIMDDPNEDSKTRLVAAIHLLDRGYGKPVSGVALLGTDTKAEPSKLSSSEIDSLILAGLAESRELGESDESDESDAMDAEWSEVSDAP